MAPKTPIAPKLVDAADVKTPGIITAHNFRQLEENLFVSEEANDSNLLVFVVDRRGRGEISSTGKTVFVAKGSWLKLDDGNSDEFMITFQAMVANPLAPKKDAKAAKPRFVIK